MLPRLETTAPRESRQATPTRKKMLLPTPGHWAANFPWLLGLLAMTQLQTAEIMDKASWNLPALSQPPATYPAPEFDRGDVRAVFYEGLPWKGKPTRVFAFLGVPKHKPGEKVPGIVLVHGGGGTAFSDWVKLWTSRGYAALAMDVSGSLPDLKTGKPVVHPDAGPEGYGGLDQLDSPKEDQWTYHAVADVILANSLLRAQPEVDPERIGITGISWGGYLTCITAAVDPRFRFAVPVYGCGFLTENSAMVPEFSRLGREKIEKWRLTWDPSRYLPDAKMPFLWVDGTNDFFPLDSLQKSYRLPVGPRTLSTRVRMPHGHGGPGENPEEILAFSDSFLKKGTPLAQITGQGLEKDRAWVTFKSDIPVVKAELNFTKDSGNWTDRKWETLPATIIARRKASVTLPKDTVAYFFNLIDERGLIVSSEHKVRM